MINALACRGSTTFNMIHYGTLTGRVSSRGIPRVRLGTYSKFQRQPCQVGCTIWLGPGVPA